MCGFVGFWSFKTENSVAAAELVKQMALQIDHRGPDSEGHWLEPELGLAFGHRRLSIVDLSSTGHQPMISASGRYVFIYNGEIYNAPELRKELIKEGCSFRGNSDTEVILEACALYGVDKTCKKIMGMFTFALWDREQKKLFLARDRLGKKPLYWGFNKGVLFFGSQLKSFFVHPAWKGEIDLNALTSYFRYNYVPTPNSIFSNMHKLEPGHYLTIDDAKNVQKTCFWSLENIISEGLSKRTEIKETKKRDQNLTDQVLIDQLDVLLKDAVQRRMIADVPLGAFLSGGIDSSTVVALMQAQSENPIDTFSIGFHEQGYNEAPYAKQVAAHLRTRHHELYLRAEEVQSVIPGIPDWCDEPFADASQIPTYLVSKLAREHVTIALSGDGGDELFAGYNRYLLGQNIWKKISFVPGIVREICANSIRGISPHSWDKIAKILPERLKVAQFGDKLHKLGEVLKAENLQHFYKLLVSQWNYPSELVKQGTELRLTAWEEQEKVIDSIDNFIERMQYMDTVTYLPDDILAKVDRASMAVSLEARVPLLDHRVVEFSWTLPLNMKLRHGKSKWLLRQVLNKYVPNHLVERPKMGFGIPIDQWLRKPLREWAETLLSEQRLREEGILNPEPIRKRWQEHLSGRRNWQYSLWGVLMFQAWKERWKI